MGEKFYNLKSVDIKKGMKVYKVDIDRNLLFFIVEDVYSDPIAGVTVKLYNPYSMSISVFVYKTEETDLFIDEDTMFNNGWKEV